MSMIHLKPFEYFEPASVKEAVSLLDTYGEKAKVLAGGIDLIPQMRTGLIEADYIINIKNIPELQYFNYDENKGLEFGSMVTLQFLDTSKFFKETYPVIQAAIHQITSVQSKYMGTLVGNLCVATPGSDIAPAMMAYDAELIISGPDGTRREKVRDFYLSIRKTSLKRGEFVIGAFIPKPSEGTGGVFKNLVRTHADIAKFTLSVVVNVENDVCKEARIALGSLAPTPVRAERAEAVLCKSRISEELIKKASVLALESIKPSTGLRSTKEYRTAVTPVLVERALTEAFKRAREGARTI